MTTTDLTDLVRRDADAIRCPHKIYEELRKGDEPVYVPEMESWLLTRYAQIATVSRDTSRFSCAAPLGPIMARQQAEAVAAIAVDDPELGRELAELRLAPRVLLHADPPAHGHQRRLVNRAFTPGKIEAMDPFIHSTAEDLIDQFADRGSADIMAELATPLPIIIIGKMLGIPDSDTSRFKKWSDDVVYMVGNQEATLEKTKELLVSQMEMFRYFLTIIRDRREHPRADIISDLVRAEIGEAPLTDGEILNMVRVFLVAGNETTSKFIAFCVMFLARNPELQQRLRENPSEIPAFTEEVLRLESPVQGLYRTAVEDTEIDGVSIRKGDSLLMAFSSGNRDDRKYADPDELELTRQGASPHLSFGIGPHFCLGAGLAKSEGRIVMELLLERLDDIRPASGTDIDRLPFEDSYLIHGPRAVPIEFSPRH